MSSTIRWLLGGVAAGCLIQPTPITTGLGVAVITIMINMAFDEIVAAIKKKEIKKKEEKD